MNAPDRITAWVEPNDDLELQGYFEGEWSTQGDIGEPFYLLETPAREHAEELLEALQNMMGAFDTPIARRRIKGGFGDDARSEAKALLSKLDHQNTGETDAD